MATYSKPHSILVCVALFVSGCSAAQTTARIAAGVPIHAVQRVGKKFELLEERRLDEEAIHQAKLAESDAERQYLEGTRNALVAEQILKREMELQREQERLKLMRAEAAQEFDQTKPQYRDRLRSQLQVEIGQSFEFGPLQVDTKKLKEVMKRHEQEQKLAEEKWKAENDRLKLTDSSDCARPAREKLADSRPTPKPLLPTQIPMMMPVSLVMEMGGPSIGKPDVQRLPLRSKLKDCQPPAAPPIEKLGEGDPDKKKKCPYCCHLPAGTPCDHCRPSCQECRKCGARCDRCTQKKMAASIPGSATLAPASRPQQELKPLPVVPEPKR